VYLLFPDPWPKKRHHKRRLVQANFVELIRMKLKMAGYIHMATDWENYAEQMLEVMTNADGFINQAGYGKYSIRPESRPLTRFEIRGGTLGHPTWDLIFVKEN
jgi:tRNA (guanine-N7-)-methyltransferase